MALMEKPSKSFILIFIFIPTFAQSKYEITFKKGFAYEKLGSVSYISNYVNISRRINFSNIGQSIKLLSSLEWSIQNTCNKVKANHYLPPNEFTTNKVVALDTVQAAIRCDGDSQLPIIENEQMKIDLIEYMKLRDIRRCWLGTKTMGSHGSDRRIFWSTSKRIDETLFPKCKIWKKKNEFNLHPGLTGKCDNNADGLTLNNNGEIEPWSLNKDHDGKTSKEFFRSWNNDNCPKVVCRKAWHHDYKEGEASITKSVCEGEKGRWKNLAQIYYD